MNGVLSVTNLPSSSARSFQQKNLLKSQKSSNSTSLALAPPNGFYSCYDTPILAPYCYDVKLSYLNLKLD